MRKRSTYRRRDVPPVPLLFGNTAAMSREMGLRSRTVIDAVVHHTATPENLCAVECEIVAAMHLVNAAEQAQASHQIEAESLATVRAELKRIGRAALGVKARHLSTGRIGCNADEREALLSLAGLLDTLRDGLPRRLWHEAYRRALVRAEITSDEVSA